MKITVNNVPAMGLAAPKTSLKRLAGSHAMHNNPSAVASRRAELRRAEPVRTPAASGETLRVADVEFDLPRMRVLRAGQVVDLTTTEFGVAVTG